MTIHFHLAGELVPIRYHYLMRLDGTLSEQDDQPNTPGMMIIVLERGGTVPTKEQDEAIGLIHEARSDWRFTFFFQRSK